MHINIQITPIYVQVISIMNIDLIDLCILYQLSKAKKITPALKSFLRIILIFQLINPVQSNTINNILMQQTFIIQCVNGHQISQMCTDKTCLSPAGICTQQDCKFSTLHAQCLSSIPTADLIQFIMKFARQKRNQTDELIITTLDRMMKALENLKNEYLKGRLRELENQWKGEIKQLYQLLKNGPANDVTPQLVTSVLEGEDGGKETQYESLGKLREIAEKVEKYQKEGLNRMRKWMKVKDTSSSMFTFHQELTNTKQMVISNQDRNIKQLATGSQIFSLITPPISQIGHKKLTLKLVNYNTQYFVYVGVGRLTKLIESDFDWTYDDEGLHVVNNNGYAQNRSSFEQHQKDLQGFEFGRGDVIEMEYDEKGECLRVGNLTKKMSVVLENVKDEEKDLHFCVKTLFEGDEWEIQEEKQQS